MAGRFFTSWAMREALIHPLNIAVNPLLCLCALWHVWRFDSLWPNQAPLSMGFPRQDYCSSNRLLSFSMYLIFFLKQHSSVSVILGKKKPPSLLQIKIKLSRSSRTSFWLSEVSLRCLHLQGAPQEKQVWSLGREDPLEKEMATHSSTLAWKISWTEEPCRLRSMGSARSRIRLSDFTSHCKICQNNTSIF